MVRTVYCFAAFAAFAFDGELFALAHVITPPKLVLCAGPDVPPTVARRAFTFVVFDARIRRRRSVRILLSLERAMARGRSVREGRLQGPSARSSGWTSTTEEGRAQVGKKYCGIQTNRWFIPLGPEITRVRYAECLTFSNVSTSRVRTRRPLPIIFRLATSLH